MTPKDALIELLDRVAALQGSPALLNTDELGQWPGEAIATMKAQKLITRTRPANSAICPGCERECVMPVHVLSDKAREPAAFIVCDKRSDINRVPVSVARLEQWQASGDAIADLLAGLLGLQRASMGDASAGRWEVGVFRGTKHASHLILLTGEKLTLTLGGHSIALAEVLALAGDGFKVDRKRLANLVDQPNPVPKAKASQKKPTATTEGLEIGSAEWRSQTARNAANALHDQPGGSRDKQQQIRNIWATGKYSSRDRCAEEECAALDMSYSAARKALRNTPEPKPTT